MWKNNFFIMYSRKVFLFTLLLVPVIIAASDQQVLIFGGNGFMGADTVEILLRNKFNVTVVNRGSWYWDAKERIFPKVNSIICDRTEDLSKCVELVKLIDSTHFDAVVDFSAYRPGQVKQSTALLKHKTTSYILISSDSVYDVSIMKDDGLPYKEEDAVRSEDESEKEHYKSYIYANNKFTTEEELLESGIPYIILRLPDVIGPRDATHRWWLYQLWMKLSSTFQHKSVGVPQYLESYSISMVYSPDVAQMINNLIKDEEDVRNQVFNLAWPETMTLRELLGSIRDELQLEPPIEIKTLTSEDRQFFLYPSGRRGPINVKKAVEVLGWEPTPWRQAVRDTVKFFEKAMTDEKYRVQMDEVIQQVEREVMKDEKNKLIMFKIIEKMYGINLTHFTKHHDEL